MIYSNDREQIRNYFFSAWRKYRAHKPLEPLEHQIVEVILIHPEYHDMLDQPEHYRSEDFSGVANPFMRMGLHLAVREQVATNIPSGVATLYQQLLTREKDLVTTEQRFVECLIKTIADTQTDNRLFDEREYIKRLKKL